MCHHQQQAVEMRTLLMWTGCLSEADCRLHSGASVQSEFEVLRWPLAHMLQAAHQLVGRCQYPCTRSL
jgi:hypothetical protein